MNKQGNKQKTEIPCGIEATFPASIKKYSTLKYILLVPINIQFKHRKRYLLLGTFFSSFDFTFCFSSLTEI